MSCFCRMLACAVLSLTSFCLSVDTRPGAVFTRRHSSRPRQVSLSALSWHSMMSQVMSARQVRLHRLWLRVDTVGTEESLTCNPCSSLTFARALEPQRCLLMVSAASGYSPTATSRCTFVGRRESWTLTSCSPCKCVYRHMLTSSRS